MPMLPIAIFASGKGSNAEKIISYFRHHPQIRVSLIVSNKSDAGVVDIANREKVPVLILKKERFHRGDAYVPELIAAGIQFLVLAGFLWKIPAVLIRAYPEKIINIHPALLPKYGGKGMYGHHVHEAVIANQETESGITIHVVDELYDHGRILFQQRCPVQPEDTPATLAVKITELEHRYFPEQIEKTVLLQNPR